MLDAPAKAKAPLFKTHTKNLFASFTKRTKKKTKGLENITARMQKEICSKYAVTINSNIGDGIKEVTNKNLNVSPSMNFFWNIRNPRNFFLLALHLTKTARNDLYHPGILKWFCSEIAS